MSGSCYKATAVGQTWGGRWGLQEMGAAKGAVQCSD